MNAKSAIIQENLILLQTHQGDAAKGLLDHLQTQRLRGEVSAYRIASTPSGQPTLIQCIDGSNVFLHDPEQPAAQAIEPIRAIQDNPPGLIVLFSCGLGYLPCVLQPVLSQSRILLIEPDYDILFLSLQTSDWRNLLPSPHLLILAGPSAFSDANELLERHGSWMKKGTRVLPGRIVNPSEQRICEQVTILCTASHHRFLAQREKPAVRNPLQITLALSETHRDLQTVLSEELRESGLEARSLLHRRITHRFMGDAVPAEELAGTPLPGSLLALSLNTFSPSGWQELGTREIRRLLWFFDDPFRFALDDLLPTQIDRCFCFDPVLSQKLQVRFSLPVTYMPAGTSFPHGPSGTPPNTLPETLGITFVGSTGLQRLEEPFLKWLANNPPAIQTIRDHLHHRILQGNPLNYDEIIALNLPLSGITEPNRIALVEDLVTFWTRCEYLSAIRESLAIYGDMGWSMESLVGPLRRCYAGQSLDFTKEAPWVFQRSTININIFNVQCVNSPILRLFDVMACGGFLLSEHRPFLDTMFRIGEELDTFRTPAELAEKIAFYRSHPEIRKEIALAGQERVRREHRFRNRFTTLFERSS